VSISICKSIAVETPFDAQHAPLHSDEGLLFCSDLDHGSEDGSELSDVANTVSVLGNRT